MNQMRIKPRSVNAPLSSRVGFIKGNKDTYMNRKSQMIADMFHKQEIKDELKEANLTREEIDEFVSSDEKIEKYNNHMFQFSMQIKPLFAYMLTMLDAKYDKFHQWHLSNITQELYALEKQKKGQHISAELVQRKVLEKENQEILDGLSYEKGDADIEIFEELRKEPDYYPRYKECIVYGATPFEAALLVTLGFDKEFSVSPTRQSRFERFEDLWRLEELGLEDIKEYKTYFADGKTQEEMNYFYTLHPLAPKNDEEIKEVLSKMPPSKLQKYMKDNNLENTSEAGLAYYGNYDAKTIEKLISWREDLKEEELYDKERSFIEKACIAGSSKNFTDVLNEQY